MRAVTAFLVGFGLLGLPMTASAQTFTAVAHGSHKIDLDTAAGAFSIWSTDDLSGVTAVRATFAMRQMRADKRWAPSFRFAVAAGDEVVELRAFGGKPNQPMILQLTHRKGAQTVSEELFMTFLMADDVADLEIDWTAAGNVIVRLKSPQSLAISATGEQHEARLSTMPTRLEISASTGELEVKSLKLGAIAP